MTTDWQTLSTTSHYQTAVAVADALREGDIDEARVGIEELIDALARADRRALKSQLVRLMAHIIKWRTQPGRRSRSWTATIENARDEIADLQRETPSLSRAVFEETWDRCFQAAKREAEAECNQESPIDTLTWDEVFETDYRNA